MAGDWIKARVDLHDDPAVVGIADRTGLDEDAVVGKLLRIWGWASRQTVDGYARVTLLFVDRVAGAVGFAAAMVAVGWLEPVSAGEIRIPKWERHHSQSAKQRALATIRMQRFRLARRDAPVTQSVTQTLPLEKRRDNTPPSPLKGGRSASRENRKERDARLTAAAAERARAERARRAEEVRRQNDVPDALPAEQVRAALRAAARARGGEG